MSDSPRGAARGAARGRDRAVHTVAAAVRERTLAGLDRPPSPAIFSQMAEEIHATCPDVTRLKCFRLARGWTVEEAIAQFHRMCDREGLRRRGLTERSWREWEAGARPDRDYTDLLCRLFETGPVQLGFARDYTPVDGRPLLSVDPVAAVAQETSEHAERAEASEIGPATLERLRTEMVWVCRRYVVDAPLPLFVEMRRLQERARQALERRIHPPQAIELYFLIGALSGLMANASMDLGRRAPADQLARAAYTYARIAGHTSLMGWARGMQASVALWDRRYADAVGYAEDGVNHLPYGSGAARLHLLRARALAMLSREEEAVEALHAADEARRRGGPAARDELHDEVGGEFAFRPAKHHYYASAARLHLGHITEAIEEGHRALQLYAEDEPHHRSYGCEAMTRAHLVVAYLVKGDEESAREMLEPLLALPPDRRIGHLTTTLEVGRELLAARPGGERLAERIGGFCSVGLAHTAARALPGRSR
ncbi:MAG: hypothetical protein DIU60_009970 [Actinomycetes bacterium]|jgi:tetratricopeptide (TPR) repeat protein|nr:MAG: hypothetical protein DIU60_07220 [Actinomycetota bacterium]